MAEVTPGSLRTLAATLRAELPHMDRTVAEAAVVGLPEGGDAAARVRLYAAAALLDTFYSGVERSLERIARTFDAVPDGPRWHADLLAAAVLDVPGTRPAVLGTVTAAHLKRYLAFRHRFRNLYLFDLDAAQMAPLLRDLEPAWSALRRELSHFADVIEQLAADIASER